MPLSQEHLSLLRAIRDEWNRAESDIKTAETVVNNIVMPSIKELRYAGRRIIDALMLITDQEIGESPEKITALLDDANFDCHRARHDAIDAATAKIAADLEIMTVKLKYGPILQAYPDFHKLYTELVAVRNKIIISRKDRQDREAIYSTIESVDFPALVQSFNAMRTCEPMMIALAKKERAASFYGKWGFRVGIGGFVVAVIAILVAVFK
jgi:hypothetical protein